MIRKMLIAEREVELRSRKYLNSRLSLVKLKISIKIFLKTKKLCKA